MPSYNPPEGSEMWVGGVYQAHLIKPKRKPRKRKATKKKGNPNYKAGRAMEYALMKELRGKGLEAMRTAGSHGVADVIAYQPGIAGTYTAHEMVKKVLEGWMRLPESKVLGDYLYAGQRLTDKVEYDIHVSPVLSVFIQCKRRKR